MKIHVIKGYFNKSTKIINTTFNLVREPISVNGDLKAIVNASDILGEEHSSVEITLEDYKIL